MDEEEERNDQQGGQKRVALGPIGEPFTSGTSGGYHGWGIDRRRGEGRVRAEAGETPPGVSR